LWVIRKTTEDRLTHNSAGGLLVPDGIIRPVVTTRKTYNQS